MKWTHQATLLRNARIKKDLSQGAVGGLLGFKDNRGMFISNIERNLSGIPTKHIPALLKALDLTSGELIAAMVRDYENELLEAVWGNPETEGAASESASAAASIPLESSEVLDA